MAKQALLKMSVGPGKHRHWKVCTRLKSMPISNGQADKAHLWRRIVIKISLTSSNSSYKMEIMSRDSMITTWKALMLLQYHHNLPDKIWTHGYMEAWVLYNRANRSMKVSHIHKHLWRNRQVFITTKTRGHGELRPNFSSEIHPWDQQGVKIAKYKVSIHQRLRWMRFALTRVLPWGSKDVHLLAIRRSTISQRH